MRYVAARLEQESRETAYRIYVTDALKVLGRLDKRYVDIVKPTTRELRTADEIKASIMDKLRGMA